MLTSPDKQRVEWAKQQITKAKETIEEAKKEQQKAIKNGADPAFKGFTGENPGFDVPSDQSEQSSKS
jgi:sRNA-binding protein